TGSDCDSLKTRKAATGNAQAALLVPKDYLRYLPAKENTAPNAPTIAVNTEMHAVNCFGSSKEEPLFSSPLSCSPSAASPSLPSGFSASVASSPSLFSSGSAFFSSLDELPNELPEKRSLTLEVAVFGSSSAFATEVPAKATATAVAPATSALREKSFMMKSFRGVKVR